MSTKKYADTAEQQKQPAERQPEAEAGTDAGGGQQNAGGFTSCADSDRQAKTGGETDADCEQPAEVDRQRVGDDFGDDMDFSKPEHTGRTLRCLWRSVSNQRRRLAVVLVSVVFYTLLSIAAPLYSAHIVDLLWGKIKAAMTAGAAFSVTWTDGGRDIFCLLLLYLATALFYTLQSYLMSSFAETLSLRLRTEISVKLNRLPLSFFDRTQPGAVLSRTVSDLDKMSEALQTGMLRLFTAAGMIVGSLVMMARFSLTLTAIFLIFTALSLAATHFLSGRTLQCAVRRQECVSAVTSLVEESYSGRTIVKAFCLEKDSAARLHRASEELTEANRRTEFLINAINPAIRLVNRLGQVLIAVLAGKMLLEGRLTVGIFQAFFQYLNQAAEPLTEAAYMVNSMQSALASLERVYALLDEPEMTAEPAEPAVVRDARGQIEFRGVRFAYTPERPLMRDVSFTVRPGQKVAIVGSTGAGKTTLVNLLMRFYETDGGAILLDGTDIKTLTRAGLRANFGMVLQDTWLFEGTIAENIAYSRPDAAPRQITAAAQAARADFFIRTMAHGYETMLSGDTENLSVGQRQLLTIARVFSATRRSSSWTKPPARSTPARKSKSARP